MTRVRLVAATLCACLCATHLGAAAEPADAFRARVQSLIDRANAKDVAVAYHDLATGEELLIHGDVTFHAASTMKVPVMMEVYRQEREGKLSFDDRITIRNDFASIVDGSRYALDPKDDSEFTLYDRIGEKETIRELVRLMIVSSSNLATNLLIDRVSAARTSDFMRSLGAPDVQVLRGVEDRKAYEQGKNNNVTARGLMHLLALLAENKVVSPESSAGMIQVLIGQKFREGIPAGVPAGTTVAHKTGWFPGVYHDAGIVLPQGGTPFVLVVLTRGIEDTERAHKLVAEIAREAHRHQAKP